MVADELIQIYMNRFINRLDIWGKAVACENNPEKANVYYQKPGRPLANVPSGNTRSSKKSFRRQYNLSLDGSR